MCSLQTDADVFFILARFFFCAPLFTFSYLVESDRVWVHTRKYRNVECTWYLSIWWFLAVDKTAIAAYYKKGPHFSCKMKSEREKTERNLRWNNSTKSIYIFNCIARCFNANVQGEYISKTQKNDQRTKAFVCEIDEWIFTHLFQVWNNTRTAVEVQKFRLEQICSFIHELVQFFLKRTLIRVCKICQVIKVVRSK